MAKEKLDLNKIALTGGIVAVILSILCALLVAILPMQIMVALVNSFFHGLDVTAIAVKNITVASFITGLIVVFVWGWLVGALFALVYNMLGKK